MYGVASVGISTLEDLGTLRYLQQWKWLINGGRGKARMSTTTLGIIALVNVGETMDGTATGTAVAKDAEAAAMTVNGEHRTTLADNGAQRQTKNSHGIATMPCTSLAW